MMKRLISLFLSLAMVLSLMPVSIGASAEENVAEEEKVLFAAWSDFSGYLYDFPELPVNMMTNLLFCLGSQEDYVILNDNLTASGCITLSSGEVVDGNQTWDIWPTEMGPGTVTYTDPESGKTYTFAFTVTEAWEGGEGSGGEGPGEEVDDSVIRLFARWDDASGFMESSEIRLDCTSPFVFCFGTYTDHIYVTDLELSGVARFDGQWTADDGAPCYSLGVSGVGDGAVTYTHTDGTKYSYSVKGTLGYPGDLIAVCTDETRGYDGLEFMPYLSIGESFEAEFAVLDSMTTYRMLPAGTEYTTEGVATLEQVEGTVYSIGVSAEGEGKIIYTNGEQSGVMYVYGNMGGEGPGGEGPGGGYTNEWYQDVQYQGQTVSVFIGDVWSEELHDIQGYGDNYGASYYRPFVYHLLLGAFTGYETDREALAPAGFYDCISNITFHLENACNEFGGEPLNCWFSNVTDGSWEDCTTIVPAPYENPQLGIKSAQTYLRADAGQGFQAKVCMTFTYDDPSDDIEEATYTVKIGGGYTSSGDVVLDLSTGDNAALVDTAEELNAILGNYDTMISWMQTNFPLHFNSFAPGGLITMRLPAVAYDDVIVVNMYPGSDDIFHSSISLYGSKDEQENRTTVPGILAKVGLHEVREMDLVYNSDVTYEDIWGNGKKLSFGILADCSKRSDGSGKQLNPFWNDVCNVGDCNFTGFDYAMCSTEYGFAGQAWGCTFTDCYYGVYIDCKGQGSGGNDDYNGNTFIGSKFAVCLRSLPGNSTPYSLRVTDNVFLNCDKEFKVTTSGNKHYFYFYRNFYGGTYQNGLALAQDYTARGAHVDLLDENGVQSTAVVLTDPSRTSLDMSVAEGFWIFGDSTSILNADADELLIAEGALSDTSIAVLDEQEEEIGLWEFETAQQTRSRSVQQENNFNAGITVSENGDGSITVTVGEDIQSDAVLKSQMPTLTVDCPFENAYVLYDEIPVPSTVADGKICFQAAQGGQYRIVSGQLAVYAAMIGDIGYETVAEALEAARSGDVAQLVADSGEYDVVVKAGVTLDLNGHTLEAAYVFVVNGANVVDNSAANTGLLKVDADCVMISSANAQLPVWNGEGYVFTTVTYKTRLMSSDSDSLKFAFLPQFKSGATKLLEDGVEGNKVTIEVRVSWMTTMGREYRNLVFNETQVDTVVGTNGAFILTFSGFSQLSMASGISVEGVVISETGVSAASNPIVVDVNGG